ncbi:type II toxin-antitoxin system ParD family antitoxin [Flavobacterium sp. UBA7680]|uniref:type II toxin-antitoxin system ParD family antitoxin n=1 Tax=Flavobacterium sp. UBA7680 TaxID=1946559 RepID=UPI0025C06D8C|nr:type II toxin-antitoxin system ParD family antitoxin [Flavobacterium sp. UBA7680]
MERNPSTSLVYHSDDFIENNFSERRSEKKNEVRDRFEDDNKLLILKRLVQEGIDSGLSLNFDPKNHLENLKSKRKK